ncbi:hypothetical protein Q4574_01080 [Aliiglaciecola sp. 3_MG-2023]|uniref:hypothetical protein n=1 Tax=Aliiglaciecola sp. 3_MG-2023 TaxID=3062644 RepID=UPI0026E4632A|nr:hypothetical protein [Aliiglaciecola sp. 3_MG-2023]MDO6691850.1 hypothetical protein [Aliiglaciecola sp. 3_MG-2023]
MKLSRCLFIATSFILSGHAVATDNMYGVTTLGYAKTSLESTSASKTSYKLAVGYQFAEKWYAEFGYHQLANQSLVEQLPTTIEGLSATDFGLKADALGISVLGKATSNYGELYYRLGILNVDVEGQNLSSGEGCEFGTPAPFNLDSGESLTLCEFDEGVAAGQIGIGFDFYLGVNLLLRTEVEHIRGEQGFEHNGAYIGLRYNFN